MHRPVDVLIGISRAQSERVFEQHAMRHITIERIVRARLICQYVGNHAAFDDFRQDVGAVPDETDRNRLPIFARCVDQLERLVKRPRDLIAITAFQSLLDARWIDIHSEKDGAVHGGGERLRATHSAQAAGQNEFSFKRPAEMFAACGRKSLKRTLHDSLAADVNPRAGGHLAIHGQSQALEAIEFGIVRPQPDQI